MPQLDRLRDFPGISPAKKKLLLEKFGSVARLKKTPVEEIAGLPGISLKLADTLSKFLSRND
ncbi:hypothetical protein HQ447_09985 [bacterium]|nr:hypothetical protein [bacterium]